MARKWTSEEIAYLKEHYGLLGLTAVSMVLERRKNAVGAKARRLELKFRKALPEEDEAIRAAILSGVSETELAATSGRTPRFVRGRARAMGLYARLRENRSGAYTMADIVSIRERAEQGQTAEEIGIALERTELAIRCYCLRNEIDLVDARVKPSERLDRLGDKKSRSAPAPAYTEAELAILRLGAEEGQTAQELIHRLPGRTATGVYLKARGLGLDIPRVRPHK